LNAILDLNSKIEHVIERQHKLHKSIQTNNILSKDNNNNNNNNNMVRNLYIV
jgi:hypothetical protein